MSKLIRNELIKSLIYRYRSEIQSNKATMLIYFNNPVGIGEHPQHLQEIDTLLENITEANDKLESLMKEFPDEDYK